MDKWSKEEINELRNFFQGEVGKKYIKRMEETKKQLLQSAMGAINPDEAFRYSAIANGFESVLQDIEMIMKLDKKEGKATKKDKKD